MIQKYQSQKRTACTYKGTICIFAGMDIQNLHQPFELDLAELTTYERNERKKTFFEMVFVLEGSGIQIINNHKLPYGPNKLFLIFPQNTHNFEIYEPSKFFFIRFNESYLRTQSTEWIHKLEFIFNNHNHLPGCILKTITDKPLIRALVEALIREHVNRDPGQEEVIKQLINTIITIAARNISLMAPSSLKQRGDSIAMLLLHYLHENIYEPEKLKSENVAKQFNISPNYISEFFKSNIGQSLQDYIIAYKLKLVETRLAYTDMQINEIVIELGFSDASHLNRLFKKYKGLSPSAFKKSLYQ
ncbi:helix-turn-helix domain-containing protein [Flavobacterium aquicola]|uniref:AraC family transcriptional regulator n=1 Tax=Flavobacterium aquicola TaxID=1682742 RepID=A0A3E0ELQ7_9FLAO|nr:AraC family transcriptional regulator [Flavobacterium aquicola]REG98670.1 AraC family transcriptional regulator [Flavobacterium aquicola]